MQRFSRLVQPLAGVLVMATAASSQAASSPLVSCGVAYSKLEAAFSGQAAKMGPRLCADSAQFNLKAGALITKTNASIAKFNDAYGDAGCDSDVPLPVPAKTLADVMLVLQNDLGAVPLDKYCNDADDSGALCGNDQEDPGETCDATDLGGQSCASLGSGTGALACAPDCDSYDLSGCSGAPYCGNGTVDNSETCDAGGNNTASCDLDCTAAQCGDGFVNAPANEQCEDGNSSDNDACLNNCQIATCGDGITRTGVEQCDDGNAVNSDACLTDCRNAFCGDGYLQVLAGEKCDDGDNENSDACVNTCELAFCGDGFVRPGVEQCDDHNNNDGDGCSAACLNEA